jgi:DNA-binding transcriptional ArsR family regulator
MLAELSPQVQLDPASTDVLIRRPGSRGDAGEIDLALTTGTRSCWCLPTFAWPELIAVMQKDLPNGREQRTILILYALSEMQQAGRAPVPPEELLKLVRSADDPTRLQILQLLARRSRFTREIAGLIGLTEAAISKHLKLLQDAGWVMPERQSYYALVRETSASLSHGPPARLTGPRVAASPDPARPTGRLQ